MPNIQSAKKRMRSDARKRANNQAVLSSLNTHDKKLQALSQDPAKAAEFAHFLMSCYDRAAACGAIPKGRADRRKSRIAHFIAKIKKG